MATMADFLPTVEAEVAAAKRFVTLLELEQEMLTKGEVEHLQELVQQKNGLAVKLATLAEQRHQALAAEGLTADRSGLSAWFSAHPTASRAHAAWTLLLSIASQARELNRINGELIQLRMQYNARALEALLGTHSALGLYGPDGQNTLPSGPRISDSA